MFIYLKLSIFLTLATDFMGRSQLEIYSIFGSSRWRYCTTFADSGAVDLYDVISGIRGAGI